MCVDLRIRVNMAVNIDECVGKAITFWFHLGLYNMVEVGCESPSKTQDVAVLPLRFPKHLITILMIVMMTRMVMPSLHITEQLVLQCLCQFI